MFLLTLGFWSRAGASQLAVMLAAAVDAVRDVGLTRSRMALRKHGGALLERLLKAAAETELVAGGEELGMAAAAVLATAMCGKIAPRWVVQFLSTPRPQGVVARLEPAKRWKGRGLSCAERVVHAACRASLGGELVWAAVP